MSLHTTISFSLPMVSVNLELHMVGYKALKLHTVSVSPPYVKCWFYRALWFHTHLPPSLLPPPHEECWSQGFVSVTPHHCYPKLLHNQIKLFSFCCCNTIDFIRSTAASCRSFIFSITPKPKFPPKLSLNFSLATIGASQVTSLCPDILYNLVNFVISQ